MKRLFAVLIIMLCIAGSAYADCGSCGSCGGDSKGSGDAVTPATKADEKAAPSTEAASAPAETAAPAEAAPAN